MKNRFLNWLTQRSTIMAFGNAVTSTLIVMASYGMVDPKWAAIVSTVLMAFGLKVNDKRLPK